MFDLQFFPAFVIQLGASLLHSPGFVGDAEGGTVGAADGAAVSAAEGANVGCIVGARLIPSFTVAGAVHSGRLQAKGTQRGGPSAYAPIAFSTKGAVESAAPASGEWVLGEKSFDSSSNSMSEFAL